MARFKDFGSPAANKGETLSFSLYDETFTAIPALQGKTLMKLIKDSNVDDPGQSAEMVLGFFEKVLVPESLERFNALMDSEDKIVPVDTMAEIVGWLVEEYSGRPEEQREG